MDTNDESPSDGTSAEKRKCCSGKAGGEEHGKRCCRRRRWIGAALVVGVIASLVAFNAYSGQSGSGSMCSTWHGHRGSHELFGTRDATRHAEFVVDRIMNEVKANDAQKLKARGIADAVAGDLKKMATQHRESHREFVAILSEPTLDRAKLEALRSKTAHSVDESSKRIAVAVADLAEVLTPAQRLQLIERMEKKHGFLATE